VQNNPPFSKTIADGLLTSVNSFTAYSDPSIPAGYVELQPSDHVLLAKVLRTGYEVELVQRTNTSDYIMATSAQFSIATSQPAKVQSSSSNIKLPVIIAIAVGPVILVIAGAVWCCWFRKRRRQIRAQCRSPTLKPRQRSSVPLGPRKEVSSNPVREAKPDIEERSADERLRQRQSTHEQSRVMRELPLPQPLPPPPPEPVQATAELPIFITPRSSRQLSHHSRRRVAAELDANPPTPRRKSFDEAELAEVKYPALPAARRSKRLSLQQILHLRKGGEKDGNAALAAHSPERLSQTEAAMHCPVVESQTSHLARRSKRLSLRHLIHCKRIAELEGSSAPPTQSLNASPRTDEESQSPLSRRSHRMSLHRLLYSRRSAELEPDTDDLPVYSRTDLDQKSNLQAPPLPPKDIDLKFLLPVPQPAKRSMTPVELDASEPKRLSSASHKRKFSYRSPSQSIAGLAGSSSSSPNIFRDLEARERGDQEPDNASEEVQITLATSPANLGHETPVPQMPNVVEFLDLASSGSEGGPDGDLELAVHGAATPLNFATPLGSPPLQEPAMDPFLTAEIISAALESSGSSPTAPESEHAEEVDHEDQAEDELPTIHEMDASESAMKRRSRRQSSYPVVSRSEAQARRPDFTTFKKQMTEAERRAKMIAKRRRSRRRLTPKSF